MFFKVYGERNSGTNFLTELLKTNFGEHSVFDNHIDLNTSIVYYWKHGYPDIELKKADDTVIDIFIIRSLEKWIVSMFHNPYGLDFGNKSINFEFFLKQKNSIEITNGLSLKNQSAFKLYIKFLHSYCLKKCGTQLILNQNLKHHLNNLIRKHRSTIIEPTEYFREHKYLLPKNYLDAGKNIFEIRYSKLNSYFSYLKTNSNSLLVSLDLIQKDKNCLDFLNFLNDNYNLGKKNFHLLNKNLKTYSNKKNTKYSTDVSLYKSIIDDMRDNSIEDFVKSLSWTFNV